MMWLHRNDAGPSAGGSPGRLPATCAVRGRRHRYPRFVSRPHARVPWPATSGLRLTPFDGVEDLSDFFVHVLNAQWSWLWNARLTQPLLACATVAAKSAR